MKKCKMSEIKKGFNKAVGSFAVCSAGGVTSVGGFLAGSEAAIIAGVSISAVGLADGMTRAITANANGNSLAESYGLVGLAKKGVLKLAPKKNDAVEK